MQRPCGWDVSCQPARHRHRVLSATTRGSSCFFALYRNTALRDMTPSFETREIVDNVVSETVGDVFEVAVASGVDEAELPHYVVLKHHRGGALKGLTQITHIIRGAQVP